MRTFSVVATLLLCSLRALAAPPPVAIPDTPAGHVLQAWLDAFNSGDRARIETYCKKYDHPNPPDAMISFARQVGGFDLLAIRVSEQRRISFLVKEKKSPTTAVGKLALGDGDPAHIAEFMLRAIPPGTRPEDLEIKVDAGLRARIFDGIAAKLTEFYVYPDLAKKMIEAMRAQQKKGEYDAISDGDTFAFRLTKDLRAVSHDGHLRVFTSPRPLPPQDPRDDDPPTDEDRAEMQRENCGFERVEHLAHNIGYVKFNFFGAPSVCGPTATAAMGLIANVDALVFDLRENHGGDPEMVSYVVSYLFANRTHVNDLWERKMNKTTEYWTKPELPGKKLVGKPVYVLTSKGTFSGGEEFTYDLKTLKRATIVGEATGGGAHPTAPKRLDDHFGIGVPVARPINPVTKKDWEGTGVEPDVKVPADRALDKALELAQAQLDAAHSQPVRR
jgi:peptidase S41-like protein